MQAQIGRSAIQLLKDMHPVSTLYDTIYPGWPPAAVAEGYNSCVGIEHYLPAQLKCL